MRKVILGLILFSLCGFALIYSPRVRVKEIERQSEVSRELHEIGKELTQFQPLLREEEKLNEFLHDRGQKHIIPENLELLSIQEEADASDPYLIYREPEVRYTFHLDGHTTVERK